MCIQLFEYCQHRKKTMSIIRQWSIFCVIPKKILIVWASPSIGNKHATYYSLTKYFIGNTLYYLININIYSGRKNGMAYGISKFFIRFILSCYVQQFYRLEFKYVFIVT